jgi:two-component system, NtrC family, sensor kinase
MPHKISQSMKAAGSVPSSEEGKKANAKWPLSIKHKLIISLLVVYLLSSLATFFASSSLARVEAKIGAIELLDALSYKVLETRRYEKNYLLYGNEEDLHLALDYLEQVRADMNNMRSMASFSSGDLPEYERRLKEYADSLHKLKLKSESIPPELIEEKVHRSGHNFTTYVIEQGNLLGKDITVAALQARRISQSILFLAVVLGVFLSVYLIRRIVSPLEFICGAASRIVRGELSTIPMVPGPDRSKEEIELVNSLNLMLRFLETKQEQLVQSAKLATIGKVTAGIAHEINNPLNNIYLTAEVLLEDLPNMEQDDRLEMVHDILNQAERAREVVHHLLAFSRSRQAAILENIDLAELIRQTLKFLKNQIRIGQVAVQTEFSEKQILVGGNTNQLQQVFVNIILNAIQAMGAGGLLSIKVDSLDRDTAQVKISDTGPGIPEDVKKRIFDPFFTTKSDGTGLGLSVSNSIIEDHNGKIVLESEKGKGTTFNITLPIIRKEE